jgi:hypothetical protein
MGLMKRYGMAFSLEVCKKPDAHPVRDVSTRAMPHVFIGDIASPENTSRFYSYNR